jgi:hypothetical protein
MDWEELIRIGFGMAITALVAALCHIIEEQRQAKASRARPQLPPAKTNIKGLTANPNNRLSKGRGTLANSPRSRPQVKGRHNPDLDHQLRLRAELDRLTRDPAASTRLLELVAAQNPGRSATWRLEKAIFDLERDRR